MGFLDNLKGTLSQGVDRAKFEADKLQRVQRIRNDINDMHQQIGTNYGQLGQRAYELFNQGKLDEPEIASLAQIINDLNARLQAANQELERAQNEQFQPEAYQQPYGQPPPQQYGQPQQYAPPPPQQYGQPPQYGYTPPSTPPQGVPAQPDADSKTCSACGFKASSEAVFCPECGNRM